MGIDPYSSGMLKKSPYVRKKEVKGTVVAVLDFSADQRGLKLIPQPSRAVITGEVHEIILTDEAEVAVDQVVNSVSYLAFVSIEESGVLLSKDNVYLNDKKIGVLAGFDETHMPNHQNIVIQSELKATGKDMGLAIGDVFRFTMNDVD